MAKCYFELRKQSAIGTESIAADIMRHLHARQHLGKAVVVCENPAILYTTARKQWLKLSRSIQKMRAATLNADKILKYTHTITHMQHMRFTYKPPMEDPEADVYFLTPEQCVDLPLHCYSAYITVRNTAIPLEAFIARLPAEGLVVDYCHDIAWATHGLQTKASLEAQVTAEWQQVEQFLMRYDINAAKLIYKDMHDIEAMDDALDILLSIPHRFMAIAYQFQRALELARPLRLNRDIRESYDAVVLLAHRVQALSPGAFTQQFLESYSEDDTFFLYDFSRDNHSLLEESLPEMLTRHKAAGRPRLAQALYAHRSIPRAFRPSSFVAMC